MIIQRYQQGLCKTKAEQETVQELLNKWHKRLGQNNAALHVGVDRKKETLKAWYDSLSEAQRAAIECVSMDMWPAFINATLDNILGAKEKIAVD